VLAIIDGNISAFSAACPHAGGPLEFAETKGQVITCPLHGWSFDLAQEGCELHGFRRLRLFDVKVEDGMVHVAFTAGQAPKTLGEIAP
jgi:nitrite reductase/ring-hydroxylating ferredoxin subunit